MEQIARITSFTVDHTKIVPGIYVSRIDGDVTTYDMRFRRPNAGDYISNIAMHSFEHMFATYVRNSDIAENVIYFGPMGCQTGFYLLTRNVDNSTVLRITKDVLARIISHDGEMFGASEIECGNYRNLSVESAKKEAELFLSVLENGENTFVYPA